MFQTYPHLLKPRPWSRSNFATTDINADVEEEKGEPTPSNKMFGFLKSSLNIWTWIDILFIQKHTELITCW